jgi:transcriptional regulator with XRE-family HTH domain
MKEDAAEVVRLLEVLRTLMRMIGFSNREVERRLGLHPSSLTRFFNGQVEAKLELVLGIARAIGLTYHEFFEFAYPERAEDEASEAANRVRNMVAGLKPAKSRPLSEKSRPALEQLLQQLLKRLEPLQRDSGDAG